MDIYASIVAAGGVFGAVATFIGTAIGLDPVALLIAIATPLLLLYSRHETRLRRLRAIKDFLRVFGSSDESGARGEERKARQDSQGRLVTNPSFEFVRSKYTADLDLSKVRAGETAYDQLDDLGQINRAIERVGRFGSKPDFRLFLSSLGFAVLTYFGVATLHQTLYCGLGADIWPNSAKACAAATTEFGNWWQIATIGSLAFAGAYVGAMRIFARAVTVSIFPVTPSCVKP